MIELQVLSRVLNTKSANLLAYHGISEEYFVDYKNEYDFIMNHVNQFGNVPDKETFVAKFPDFNFVEVAETDRYLVDTFNEEHLYALTVPVVNKLAQILQTDSRAAVDYLQSQLANLVLSGAVTGVNIIATADCRYAQWVDKQRDKDKFFIPSGFEQLDRVTGGWQRGEELVVLFARTGQGKSWILIKCLENAWKQGKVVGLLEPEMSANQTGYRFDTLTANIPNDCLVKGDGILNYKEYIESIKSKDTPFYVCHPKDFKRKVTISKLRSWVQVNKIDILGIDGISYLVDERKERGDNRTTSLTNISEDLMDLSIELGIPIIVVCQSNREGAGENAPEVENIRDSDGIAYNSSTIIAAIQRGTTVELVVRKNRTGRMGDKFTYDWDINTGVFEYVYDDAEPVVAEEPRSRRSISKTEKF